MRTGKVVCGLALLLLAVAAGGCAKNYVITTPLAGLLSQPAQFEVGEIADQLPADLEADKRPTAEDMAKFRTYIAEEIGKREIGFTEEYGGGARYEVTGSLLEYKRGSGTLRFFIGFGAGSAKVTTQLKLVDKTSGETLFAGNFTGTVTGWADSGDKMFRQVAADFSNELAKKQPKAPRAPDLR